MIDNSNTSTSKSQAVPFGSDEEPSKLKYSDIGSSNLHMKNQEGIQNAKAGQYTANKNSVNNKKQPALSASPSKANHNRNLSKSPMKAVWPQESSEGKYMIKYKSILDFDPHGKSFQDLETQNRMLRKALKDFNEQLKEDLERSKVVDFVGKKVEFNQKSSEEKLRTIIRELANNEKILAINEEEYRKAEARTSMIKSPVYLLDIQEKIVETNKQIEDIRRENKKTELENVVIGKDLDKIENITGLPSSIEEAQEKERECETLKRKLTVLKQKNAASLEEKERKLEKAQKMNHQMKNMQIEMFGVDEPEDEKIAAKRKTLQRKVKLMEDDLKFTENKYKKFIENTLSKELEELLGQNKRDCEHLGKLEEIILEQSSDLRDLVEIESFKKDKGTKQVMERIKESLSDTDKLKTWSLQSEVSPMNGQHARSQTIKKNRNVDLGFKIKNDVNLGSLHSPTIAKYPATSKNKLAVKRELGGSRVKSVWKENGNGERMDIRAKSNIASNETEDPKLYSKPAGIKKPSREKEGIKQEKSAERTSDKKRDGSKSKGVSRKASQEDVTAKENSKKVPKLEKLVEENRKDNSSPAQKSKREKQEDNSPAPKKEKKKSSPKLLHNENFDDFEDGTFVTAKAQKKEKPKKEEEEERFEEEEKKPTFFGKNKGAVKPKYEENIEENDYNLKEEEHKDKAKPHQDDDVDYTYHRRTSGVKNEKKSYEDQSEQEVKEPSTKKTEKLQPLGEIKVKKETKVEKLSARNEEFEEIDFDKEEKPSKIDHKKKNSYEDQEKDEDLSQKETLKFKAQTKKEKEPVKEIKNKDYDNEFVDLENSKPSKPAKFEDKKEKVGDLYDDPFEDEPLNEVKKVSKPAVIEKKKEAPKKEADDFEEFDFDNEEL